MIFDIHIRKYQEKDWNIICSIFERAKPDEMRGSCDLKAIKPLKEDVGLLKSFNDSQIFVAEIEDKVVGFSGYCGSYVSWLIVDPNYYRKGIGQKLLTTVLEYVGEKAYLNVAGFNESAKRLYFKMGFKVVKEYIGNYNGFEAKVTTLALNPKLNSWVV